MLARDVDGQVTVDLEADEAIAPFVDLLERSVRVTVARRRSVGAEPRTRARGLSILLDPVALSVLKRSTSPVIFQRIVWGNVHKLLQIPA